MTVADLALVGGLLLLLVAGTPIAVALAASGLLGIAAGLDAAALATIGTNTYNGIAKYPLIAIPLFVLAGLLFERSGVAGRLIALAQAVVGPGRGALAVVAVLVCMILGGMSGSGPADAAAVATVMIPSMRRAGYPPAFSAAVIAAAGSTAILIPPSIALILYSILLPGADLRALFAAGLIPGILCGLAVMAPAVLLSRRGGFGRRGEAERRPAFWPSLLHAGPGLLAPVLVLGGLRSGAFTPTEAAAVAAVYGLVVGGLFYRTLTWRAIYRVLVDAAETSAVVMLVIALAGIFAWAGGALGSFDRAAAAVLASGLGDVPTLALLLLLLVGAGLILDGVSIYLIMMPLLIPVLAAYQWNGVWFGVLMAITIAVGQFTPPVAVNLMVTARVAGVPIDATIPWVVWMVLAMLATLALVVALPDLALWLPQALGYRV